MPKSVGNNSTPPARREDHEFPAATARLGWRYHHLGIPTRLPQPHEKHLPEYGMFVSGFDTSEFGIEWMRFEEESPLPEIIRTVSHLAFVVDEIESALAGRDVLFPVRAPSGGVRTAMILVDGAPIELMEFDKRGDGRTP
jgi:hypothetical protein